MTITKPLNKTYYIENANQKGENQAHNLPPKTELKAK